MRRLVVVVAVNIAVLVVLLFVVELGGRIYAHRQPEQTESKKTVLRFAFYPYLMTGQEPNAHYRSWYDTIRKRTLAVDLSTNNYGYPDEQDFNLTVPYRKRPGEKTVLLTGGSTAFGLGATANAHLINEDLERLLNAAQSDVHYTVINVAQGGWIAEQEAISLDLWGRIFDPDWILTLDGANDATVGCAMSQGTGNPVYFQLINSLVTSYLTKPPHVQFYRGYWENQLIKYSTAYRLLSGKTFIEPPQHLDRTFNDVMLQVTTPTRLVEVHDQLAFYLLTEKSILERFGNAKFVLTTQPTNQDFAFELGDFYRDGDGYTVDKAARDAFAAGLEPWLDTAKPREQPCGGNPVAVGYAVRYIFAMSAIRMAEMAEEYQATHRRDVEYFNTGLLYPRDTAARGNYFIDTYHLNDLGQEVLAKFFAYRILVRDFPERDWRGMRPVVAWFQAGTDPSVH
jgi:hypothetical protein